MNKKTKISLVQAKRSRLRLFFLTLPVLIGLMTGTAFSGWLQDYVSGARIEVDKKAIPVDDSDTALTDGREAPLFDETETDLTDASDWTAPTHDLVTEDNSTDADDPAVASLPAYWDSREIGKSPVIKSQGKRGTCWAITATSALEAAFMPEEDPVFSADHMSLQNGFVIDISEGGDYRMIMAYLSGWYGPVFEWQDPYGDDETTEGLSAVAHVKEMRILEGADRDTFKEMIRTYGCVQSSLYMSRRTTSQALDFYNEETCAYRYTQKKKADHDILLLGWDDNFPREAFKSMPEEDGAWICQNTWGEDFGQDGIFYVSYEDAVLCSTGIVYTRVEKPIEGERIVQTDVCGWQGRIGYESEECSFANVFEAGTDESLNGIGFYSVGAHSDYEIYVVHDFEDSSSFIFKKTIKRGAVDGMGYFCIDLEEPVPLGDGERFAVIVSIKTEGAKKPVAVEMKKDSYTQKVTLEGKEGYISPYGGEWVNTEKKFRANVCLKAYLRPTKETDDG